MPAFFGDGYGFIEQLLSPAYYALHDVNAGKILVLLACLCGIKVVATCLTLGSGGSGGVIAMLTVHFLYFREDFITRRRAWRRWPLAQSAER
jgi:H+/Cl- antiporter ClcA